MSQRPPAQRVAWIFLPKAEKDRGAKCPNPRPPQILKNLPQKRKDNPGGKRKRPPGLPVVQRRIQKRTARDVLQKFSFVAACHRILIFFS